MEILGAKVNWYDEFDNAPVLEIKVAELRRDEEFRFATKPLQSGSTLYRAGLDGFVHYFCQNPRDTGGFGGRVFKIRDHVGNDIELKGPWSSRAGVINQHFTPHTVDVILNDGDNPNSRWTSAVTLDIAIEAIKMTGNWLARIVEGPSCEITYEPVMRRSAPKRIVTQIVDGPSGYFWEYVHPDVMDSTHRGIERLQHPILGIGYHPGTTMEIAKNPITEDPPKSLEGVSTAQKGIINT